MLRRVRELWSDDGSRQIRVSGGEIKVTTAAPVSILTPPLFPPDSPVDIEVVVANAAKRVSVRTDAEGRLPFTTGPQECVIRLAGPPPARCVMGR